GSVQGGPERQMHTAVAVRLSELVRRHGERRERRCRLRAEESESFFELRRDERAERDVVHECHEAYVTTRVASFHSLGRITQNERNLPLEVETHARIRKCERR